MSFKSSEIVIVGDGISALMCAWRLCQDEKAHVTLVSPDDFLTTSSSEDVGLAVCIPQFVNGDSLSLFVSDVCDDNNGFIWKKPVLELARRSQEFLDFLIRLGIQFDRDSQGYLNFLKPQGHSVARLLTAQKPLSRQMSVLLNLWAQEISQKFPQRLTLRPYHDVLDLVREGDRCVGLTALDKNVGQVVTYRSDALVMAFSDGSGLYGTNSLKNNEKGSSLLGWCSLKELALTNLEFLSVSPFSYQQNLGPRSVLTYQDLDRVTVKWFDGDKEQNLTRFWNTQYLSQLPYDQVARLIHQQTRFCDNSYAFIRPSDVDDTSLKNLLFKDADKVSFSTAVLSLRGGLAHDESGQTPTKGVYACGQAQGMGRGIKEIPGYDLLLSTLGSIVLAENLIKSLAESDRTCHKVPHYVYEASTQKAMKEIETFFDRVGPESTYPLQQEFYENIQKDLFLERDVSLLQELEEKNKLFVKRLGHVALSDRDWRHNSCLSELFLLTHQLALARAMICQIKSREESRLNHFRADYPVKNINMSQPQVIQNQNGAMINYFVNDSELESNKTYKGAV